MTDLAAVIVAALSLAPAPTPVQPHKHHIVIAHIHNYSVSNKTLASFYGGGEKLNRHTSNGEVFRPGGFTAAHRTLPMGTRLQVCYRGCATVRINDRGPAAWTGRSLDLARGAASAIGLTHAGVAPVSVQIVSR